MEKNYKRYKINHNVEPVEESHILQDIIKPYILYEEKIIKTIYHFYLVTPIDIPILYVDMIHIIKYANEEDTIVLHINCEGGNLSTGIQIINAIRVSNAHIVCILESLAHSMASLIFLSGDELIIHDDVLMLIHNWSGGTYGKGNEQSSEITAAIKWYNKFAERIYVPFISKKEFNQILKGADLWLHSDEIRLRINDMIKMKSQLTE